MSSDGGAFGEETSRLQVKNELADRGIVSEDAVESRKVCTLPRALSTRSGDPERGRRHVPVEKR
jgi:hypothetical protein